jgi:hypothetical protein
MPTPKVFGAFKPPIQSYSRMKLAERCLRAASLFGGMRFCSFPNMQKTRVKKVSHASSKYNAEGHSW